MKTQHDWAFGGMGGYCFLCGSQDYDGSCPPNPNDWEADDDFESDRSER